MNQTLNALLSKIERALVDARLHDAAAMLNQAQKLDTNDARIYVLGGLLGRRAGNPGAAVMALRTAVSLAPGWSLAHTQLGHALEQAGRRDEALSAYRRALTLDASDAVAAARVSALSQEAPAAIANAEASKDLPIAIRARVAQLFASGQFDEALTLVRGIIAATPSDVEALVAAASIERARGDLDAAAHWLNLALVVEPDNRTLRFRLATLRGEAPVDTPPEVIAMIFDQYADRFDEHLVGGLNYHAHEAVVAMLRARCAVPTPDILDLGCGTGLVGAALAPPFGRLVGVDLSAAMLQRAQARNVYTELQHAELVQYLKSCADASFDVVVAADVFVYIGDLQPGFAQIARVLCAGGIAVISLEAGTESGYRVLSSGRFTHHRAYIERTAIDAGLMVCDVLERQLRMQQGAPVAGYLVCLRSPADGIGTEVVK